MDFVNWVVPGLVMIVGTTIWLRLYFRYGREPVIANPPDRLSEPPYEWTPVQLGLLWNQGRLGHGDMVASLIDLVRRGVLEMRVEPVSVLEVGGMAGVGEEYDFSFRRVRGKEREVTPAERYLIEEIIFRYAKGAESASLTDAMVEGAREHRAACGRNARWAEIARKEPLPFPLVDAVSERMSARGSAVGLTMLLSYFVLGVLFPSVAILALVAVAGILTAASGAIRRRTSEGAEALARWQAFRRHLMEVSSLGEALPQSAAIWGRYLVYAISLGVAGRVVDEFRLLDPTRANISVSSDKYSSVLALGGDPFCRAFLSLGTRGERASGEG